MKINIGIHRGGRVITGLMGEILNYEINVAHDSIPELDISWKIISYTFKEDTQEDMVIELPPPSTGFLWVGRMTEGRIKDDVFSAKLHIKGFFPSREKTCAAFMEAKIKKHRSIHQEDDIPF